MIAIKISFHIRRADASLKGSFLEIVDNINYFESYTVVDLNECR